MGSQIPVYYTCGYPFSYLPRAHDGFYRRVPAGMGIFAIPKCVMLFMLKYGACSKVWTWCGGRTPLIF